MPAFETADVWDNRPAFRMQQYTQTVARFKFPSFAESELPRQIPTHFVENRRGDRGDFGIISTLAFENPLVSSVALLV